MEHSDGSQNIQKDDKSAHDNGPGSRFEAIFAFMERLPYVKFAGNGIPAGSMEKVLKTILAALKSELQASYANRLVGVILFGSLARGDAQPGSDIDILIVLKGRVDPATEIAKVGPITAALSLTNDVVISCVFISEERFATEQSPLLINVRREGVVA